MTSALPGFFKLSRSERLARLSSNFQLTDEDLTALNSPDCGLNPSDCETMIENFISRHITPVGVATNFIIDGREVVIPMATEEPSVIAGASLAAKLARPSGGFTTAAGSNTCSGQVVFLAPLHVEGIVARVKAMLRQILQVANETMPSMVARTGGAHHADVREVATESGNMIIIEIDVHVGDSMGANAVIQACEAVKAFVSREVGLEPLLGILTNLSQKRIVYATARWRIADLNAREYDGFDVANRIIMAANLAKVDPARAATHRKGIMNGITAVVGATGNDSRAIEAAVHSYAALPTSNPALTQYRIEENAELVGEIWIPVPVGIVGGSINRDATAGGLRKLMKVQTADDLAKTIAAVGLAQNFAALRALVTQGITAGHMKLHSRNVACEAGAKGDEIVVLADKMVHAGAISVTAAKKFLQELRCDLH
jgi:degradative hydroxymethylglutaryl-CoA reductase